MNEEKLLEAGINVPQGLARFSNNRNLYMRFLKSFPVDTNFKDAKQHFANKDYEKLLFSVHALKGVSGNLSINSVYESCTTLVCTLRTDITNEEEVSKQFQKVCLTYDIAIQAIATLE